MKEDRIHASVVEYLRLALPYCKVWHTPNGELRDKRTAAKLKWLGVLPGVPDILILAPGGVLYQIEVKAPGGALSASQKAWRDWCDASLAPFAVVHSIDEARDAIAEWRLPSRDASQVAA